MIFGGNFVPQQGQHPIKRINHGCIACKTFSHVTPEVFFRTDILAVIVGTVFEIVGVHFPRYSVLFLVLGASYVRRASFPVTLNVLGPQVS